MDKFQAGRSRAQNWRCAAYKLTLFGLAFFRLASARTPASWEGCSCSWHIHFLTLLTFSLTLPSYCHRSEKYHIMATLNLSTNGPSIKSSYTGVINSPPASGPAASSPTYGNWALFSVSAPLVTAFQQDAGGKESILKVQSTGG